MSHTTATGVTHTAFTSFVHTAWEAQCRPYHPLLVCQYKGHDAISNAAAGDEVKNVTVSASRSLVNISIRPA